MRFISKSSNLCVILKQGLSAQPITGTLAKPTVSIRFKDGVADVPEGELTELMLAHPAFNVDYISAEINVVDPYPFLRNSSEPTHVMTEMKYGTPIARKIEGGQSIVPPDLQKLVQTMSIEMAKEMLPGMIKATLQGMMKEQEEQKTEEKSVVSKPKGKPGRKAVVKPIKEVTKEAEIAAVDPYPEVPNAIVDAS